MKTKTKHTHIGVRTETKDRFEAKRKAASKKTGFKIKMTDYMDALSKKA